jgi:pentatricopeptide repeat protein
MDCYARGLDADDLAESFYQGLMRCHAAQGRIAEGIAVFRRLRQTLSVVLGVAPSTASEALVRRLHDQAPAR